jgi:hypothetical protein
MALMRFLQQALIGALAFVGALYLGFHALVWTFFPGDTAPNSADIAGSVLSPDGQRKAVVISLVGPPGGGSQVRVGVIPSDAADATAWADRNLVFHAGCYPLGDTFDMMKKNVVWKSAKDLQITFEPNLGCGVTLQGGDARERAEIHVQYAIASSIR